MKDLDKSNPFLQKCLPHRSQNVNVFWITMFILIQLRMSPTSSLSMKMFLACHRNLKRLGTTWYLVYAFYFTEEALFILEISKYLHLLLPPFFLMSSIVDKTEGFWYHLCKPKFKNKLFNILRSKECLILKLDQLTEDYKREIFVKRICRKCTPENSSRPPFNFGKELKIKPWFLFLNPVSCYGIYLE